jgi:Stage II sporulation protein E (SpoIIE)/PAS fold/GAF domain
VDLTISAALIGHGLMQAPLPVFVFDTELRIVWTNDAAQSVSPGARTAQWTGRRLRDVVPGIDAASIERSLRHVLRTGETADIDVSSWTEGNRSPEQFWSGVQFPFAAPDGQTAGVILIMREVTERTRSQQRLALTDEASARIGTTLDTTQTAQELLDVAIPRLADVGAVDLLTVVIDGALLARQAADEEMHLRRVALRWPPGSRAPADYTTSAWLDTDPTKLYHRRLVADLPTFVPDFGAMSIAEIEDLDSGIGRARLLAARAAGARSLMVVPLTARGVIMGLVVLYRLAGSKPFTPADLSLARALVSRAAVAIDNARLYTRERASALALQHGLLPRRIPEVAGLELAYRYIPAQTAEVGGDWFDVIPLSGNRTALIVGDVTGHDMRAASLMGQLRTATHTLATLDLTPSQLLARLDQITGDLTDEEATATCVYAVHDADTGDWDIARAGHPLPAVVRPGESPAFLDLPPGMPLGVGIGHGQYEATRVRLPPGSTIVLYTDGLVESPAADIDSGMASLARVLATIGPLSLKEACDTLLSFVTCQPADDIAILLARTS